MFYSCSASFSAALGDNIIIDSQRNYVGIRCTTGWLILHLSVDSLLPWGGQDPPQQKLSVGESERTHHVLLSVYCSQAVINT